MQQSGLIYKVLAKDINLAIISICMVVKAKRMDEVIEGENMTREKFYNQVIRSYSN